MSKRIPLTAVQTAAQKSSRNNNDFASFCSRNPKLLFVILVLGTLIGYLVIPIF